MRRMLQVTLCFLITSPLLAGDGPASTAQPKPPAGQPAKTGQPAVPPIPTLTIDESPLARQRLETALGAEVTFRYTEAPLVEAIQDTAIRYNIPIIIRADRLEVLGVDPHTPISIALKGVSLRSALRLMLRELELTYVIDNEVLQITTEEDAESILRSRFYSISTLLSKGRVDGNAVAKLITKHVAPETWNEMGGSGAITFIDHLNTLVVTQSDAVHRQIDTLLASAAKRVQQRRVR